MSQKHVTWSCPNNQAESDKKKEKKTKKTVHTFIHLFLYLLPTNRPKLKKRERDSFSRCQRSPFRGHFIVTSQMDMRIKEKLCMSKRIVIFFFDTLHRENKRILRQKKQQQQQNLNKIKESS